MTRAKIITSDAVSIFVERGGELIYIPRHTPTGWEWELWARREQQNEPEQVISSKTGEPRVFKSADALIRFHRRMWPEAKGLYVEYPPDVQN